MTNLIFFMCDEALDRLDAVDKGIDYYKSLGKKILLAFSKAHEDSFSECVHPRRSISTIEDYILNTFPVISISYNQQALERLSNDNKNMSLSRAEHMKELIEACSQFLNERVYLEDDLLRIWDALIEFESDDVIEGLEHLFICLQNPKKVQCNQEFFELASVVEKDVKHSIAVLKRGNLQFNELEFLRDQGVFNEVLLCFAAAFYNCNKQSLKKVRHHLKNAISVIDTAIALRLEAREDKTFQEKVVKEAKNLLQLLESLILFPSISCKDAQSILDLVAETPINLAVETLFQAIDQYRISNAA